MAVGLAFAPAGVTVGDPPPPPPFSPDDLATLGAWFEADTLSLSDNDPVASWTDSSPNGNTLTQGVGGNQPVYKANILNSLPVVRFDGSDDYLAKASPTGIPDATGPLTIVAVASRGTGIYNFLTQKATGFWGWELGHGDSGGGSTALARFTIPVVGPWDLAAVWPAASTFYVQTLVFDASADVTYYRNGTSVGTVTGTTFSAAVTPDFQIGRSANSWDGDVAALLVFDEALSTPDREDVEGWALEKYGL